MKKSNLKFILLICCLVTTALACLLCGCDVSFDSGATVRVIVESELSPEDYAVTSSFGTVSGENGEYTVSVEFKRDFLVTVSADGYETYNLQITVQDIASGECERTVTLSQKARTDVTLTVDGITDNIAATCAGKALDFRSGSLRGSFTREELSGGITVTADGAQERVIQLTETQLQSIVLTLESRLVPAGHKLLTVRDMSLSDYAVKDDGAALSMTKVSTAKDVYTGYVDVPAGYAGEIRILSYEQPTNATRWSYVFDENTGAYDAETAIAVSEEHEIILYLTAQQTEVYRDGLYYEKDGALHRFPATQSQGRIVLSYSGSLDEIEAFWLLFPTDREELPAGITPEMNCMYYSYGGESSLSLGSFEVHARPDGSSGIIRDAFTRSPYAGDVYCGDTKLIPDNGVYTYTGELSSMPNGETDIVRSGDYVFVNGAWRELLLRNDPVTYTLKLIGVNGEPLSGNLYAGDSPVLPEDLNAFACFTETADGVYSYTAYTDGINKLGGYAIFETASGTAHFSLAPYDLSAWTVDGRNLSATVTVRNTAPVVFKFQYALTDTRSEYMIRELSFTDGDGNALDYTELYYSRKEKYYQVVAPTFGSVKVTVTYSRYNNLTGALGDPVTREFEFDTNLLLTGGDGTNGTLVSGAFILYVRPD